MTFLCVCVCKSGGQFLQDFRYIFNFKTCFEWYIHTSGWMHTGIICCENAYQTRGVESVGKRTWRMRRLCVMFL